MIDALSTFDGKWRMVNDKNWKMEPISPGISRPLLNSGEVEAKEEFLTIFYKELLKQVFKEPNLSLGDSQQKGVDLVGSFGSDLMVEQLARELAKKGSFDARWINLYRGGR